jgi:hypothetical protein
MDYPKFIMIEEMAPRTKRWTYHIGKLSDRNLRSDGTRSHPIYEIWGSSAIENDIKDRVVSLNEHEQKMVEKRQNPYR